MDKDQELLQIREYLNSPRWNGISRDYSAEKICALRGSIQRDLKSPTYSANKLWHLCNGESFVRALGASTGHMAVQMVTGGLKAIYCSGWQVAGDANTADETYPDQSIYPVDSVPRLVRRINNALLRKDQIQKAQEKGNVDWMVPIVADAEAGFGGVNNTFELMKAMILAGAAGVHLEDQLASEKKCGHMGGKVVIPTNEFIKKLKAARLASDILQVPSVLIARTDADSAKLLANDIDERDHPYIVGERNSAGFFKFKGGIEAAICRGLAYAPYADMLWCETSNPNLDEARVFAEAIHAEFPGKLLAYNCSPSFNWKKYLGDEKIATFQEELGKMGYKFQFITLAGFHALNYALFMLSKEYCSSGMPAYVELQQAEFEAESLGYTAHRHQEEVGTGYYDLVQQTVTGEDTETVALRGSTEEEQFKKS